MYAYIGKVIHHHSAVSARQLAVCFRYRVCGGISALADWLIDSQTYDLDCFPGAGLLKDPSPAGGLLKSV